MTSWLESRQCFAASEFWIRFLLMCSPADRPLHESGASCPQKLRPVLCRGPRGVCVWLQSVTACMVPCGPARLFTCPWRALSCLVLLVYFLTTKCVPSSLSKISLAVECLRNRSQEAAIWAKSREERNQGPGSGLYLPGGQGLDWTER